MLSRDVQEFAKKVSFKKTKDGWKDKQGFLLSEDEINNFYNEIKSIISQTKN